MAALGTMTLRGLLWQHAKQGVATRWAEERARWSADWAGASRADRVYCVGSLAFYAPFLITLSALLLLAVASAVLTTVGLPAIVLPRPAGAALRTVYGAGVAFGLVLCAARRATDAWAWVRRRPWPVLPAGVLAVASAGWAVAKTGGLLRARALVLDVTHAAPENFPHALEMLAWLQAALLAACAVAVVLVAGLGLATIVGLLLLPFTAGRAPDAGTVSSLARQGRRAGTFGLCAVAAVLLTALLGPSETAINRLAPWLLVHGDYAADRACSRRAPNASVAPLQHHEGRFSVAARQHDGKYDFGFGSCD